MGKNYFAFLRSALHHAYSPMFSKRTKRKIKNFCVQATESCVWSLNKQFFIHIFTLQTSFMHGPGKITIYTFYKTVFVVRITVLLLFVITVRYSILIPILANSKSNSLVKIFIKIYL